MKKFTGKTVWMQKAAWSICSVAAVTLCIWCLGDNLGPVFRENGTVWMLHAAGFSVEEESPESTAPPTVKPSATPSAEPSFPELPPEEDGILEPWTEPKPAATPDPERETGEIIGQSYGGGENVDGFYVRDESESGVDLHEELQIDPDISVKRDGSPVVLLYSTHSCESFVLEDADWYYLDDDFRSIEPDENISSVAAEAAKVIEAGGFGVIHDTTVHDYPAFSGCYQRSMDTVMKNLEEHPTIQITVDIHRDAFGEDGTTRFKPVTELEGESVAQMMILTGCDLSEESLFPDWRDNLHFALRLQQKGEELFPGLMRPLYFCQRNYNMDVTHGSILVEVGTEANTIFEAQKAGKRLGEMILAVLEDQVADE